jgi:hypothetical protein
VPLAAQQLHETYHGVYVNVQYTVMCHMTRGVLSKDLHKEIEFIVEVPCLVTCCDRRSPSRASAFSLARMKT